jgi:hypothetical protein
MPIASSPTRFTAIDVVEDIYSNGAKLANNITCTLAAGASNTTTCTITVKDSAGTAIAAVHTLEVFISRSATGQGLTATAASGALTATTGAILTALTAKKHISAVTDANGVLVLSLVDSAKTEGEYFVAVNPVSGKLHVSAATVTADYGA